MINAGRWSALLWPLAAVLIALTMGGIVIGLAGFNPLAAYHEMLIGVFGDKRSIGEVLIKAIPVTLIGSGLAVSFRTGVWNIGAEGQFYAGGIATTFVALHMGGVPSVISIPVILVCGALAGAAWAGIAGVCRAWFGTTETVTTIMLNYVAIILTSYLVTGPLMETRGLSPQSDRFPPETLLPNLLSGTRLNISIILVIAVAVFSWYLISQTGRGFAWRMIGASPDAARYAGANVKRNIVLSICYSGALAGLAGSIELLGITKRLFQSISPGYGFEGIAVALLANNNPLYTIFSGFLFGALRSGSEIMQLAAGVPSVLVFVIQGLVIVCVVTFAAWRSRAQ